MNRVHVLSELGYWSFPSQFLEVPYKLRLLFLHDILVFSLLPFAYNILLSISFNYYLFLCSQIYLYVVILFPIGSGFWDRNNLPLLGYKVSRSCFLPCFHFVYLDLIWNLSWCEVWGVDPIKYFPMLFWHYSLRHLPFSQLLEHPLSYVLVSASG